MAKGRLGMLGIVLCGLVLVGGAAGGQTSSSASASSSVGDGVRVTLGTFVVEAGARLAFEIVREDPCRCLCDPVRVTGMSFLDGSGTTIRDEPYEAAVDTVQWLGRVALVDEEGDPLPEGSYTIRIATSVGPFEARIEIVPSAQMARAGRFTASASVCGLELRVYRLITGEDDGATIALRRGDRLMVALAGNATTGYQWDNTLVYEYAVLRESEEMEYRAKPQPQEMVGFGGEFLFRYEAIDVGPQAFRFIYHQPWMSVQPAEIIEFDAQVY